MSDTIRVTLPDGSVREVAAGTTSRQVAEGIGAGPRAGGRWPPRWTASVRDLDRPIERGRLPRHPHRSRSRGARGAAPLLGPRPRDRGARALSRCRYRLRPADRGRLLLRLRGATAVHARGPGADRSEDGRGREAPTTRSCARSWTATRPTAASPTIRSSSSGSPSWATTRPSRVYTDGPFTDLCRGPARPEHRAAQAFQAAPRRRAPIGGATSSGRCSSGSTAPPGSRRRTSTPTSTGSRRRASATTGCSGEQLDLFSISEVVGPGLVLWHPQGCDDQVAADPRGRGRQRRQWLRPRLHAQRHPRGAVPDLGAPAALRREPVSAHGGRRRRVGGRALPGEADELPDARAHLQEPAAELPRPAAPAERSGQRLPEREVGHAARPAAGARPQHGRRAHLLHAWTRSRTRSSSAWTRWTGWCGQTFGFELDFEISTRPEERLGERRDLGPRGGDRCSERWSGRGFRIGSTRAAARSTGPRSTSSSGTRSAGCGRGPRSSSTSTCRSGSSSSTPGRTTGRTGR